MRNDSSLAAESDLVDRLALSAPSLKSQLDSSRADPLGEHSPWMEGGLIARYIANIAEQLPDSQELVALLREMEVLLSIDKMPWIST